MRIVCLIRDEPPFRYFVNRIHRDHGVDLVVLQIERHPLRRKIETRFRQQGAAGVAGAAGRKLRRRTRASAYRSALDARLGPEWQTLASDIPVLATTSVNHPDVVRAVGEIRPDLLLDHGTSLVRAPVLREAKLGLNLHWGLSPYYRGTYCTQWALLHWDPYNIGVTIHELSHDIDGGRVVGQARAALKPDDTAYAIELQLTYLGTEIVLGAANRVSAGRPLQLVAQDLSSGLVTYNRQWHPRLARHIEAMERRSTLRRMLESPSRPKLPIVSPGS